MKNTKKILCCLVILSFISSCSFRSGKSSDHSAYILYSKSIKAINFEDYSYAIKKLKSLRLKYPYSDFEENAFIMQAYALYHLDKSYNAIMTLSQDFEMLYPNSIFIPYIYYLKAMYCYKEIENFKLDQSSAVLAKQHFEYIKQCFPNTKYATDSYLKLSFINENLSAKEMLIGKYYLDNNNILPAINRFFNIIQNYANTTFLPEALFRLVECFTILGLREEAKKCITILSNDYINTIWYQKAYALLN